MKHLLLSYLIVFCSSFICLGQSADFTKVYSPNIINAELAITREDYAAALSHYSMAFKSVKSGFARDYRNAILCAIRCNDDAFAFAYLEKLALKGCDKDYFMDPGFEPLRSKSRWGKWMDSFERLQAESLKTIQGELLKELVAMGERDELFRLKEGSYEASYEVYGDTIAKIDVENVLRFQQLVDKYGFPSEELIGTFQSERDAPFFFVLLHNAQNLSNEKYKYPRAPSLDKILVQAAIEGKCSAAHAGYLLSVQNDPSLRYGAWGINRIKVNGVIYPNFLLDKIPDNQLISINRLRAGIGLESLDQYRMKCQFLLDNPDTPFKLNGIQNMNIWELDEEMVQIFEGDCVKLTPTSGK